VPTHDKTARGTWWLPGEGAEVVTGVLHIGGADMRLELDGALAPFEPELVPTSHSFKWVQYPVVSGNTDAGLFTLLDVQGMTFGLPEGSGTTENYSVRAAIEAEVLENPPTFSQLTFSTDYLALWLRPDGPRALPPTSAVYGMTAPREQVFSETQLTDGHIQLRAFTSTRSSPLAATMETDVSWVVTPAQPADLFVMLNHWVTPLQNLASFATLSPNRVIQLRVRERAETPLAFVHLELRRDRLPASAASYLWDHKLVLTSTLMRQHGAEIVRRWMGLRSSMPGVIWRLLGRDYLQPTDLEHYVTSAVQAAEGLHTRLWNRPAAPAEDHDARVAAATAGIADEELRHWATTVLQNANGLSLRKRLEEIVERASEAGCPHVPANAHSFCRDVASFRNAVSHGNDSSNESLKIYWQAAALTWLLRAIILQQLDVAPEVVSNLIEQNNRFQQDAHQVGWIGTDGAAAPLASAEDRPTNP